MHDGRLLKDMSDQDIVNAIYNDFVIGEMPGGIDYSDCATTCLYGVRSVDGSFDPNTTCFVGYFIPKEEKYANVLLAKVGFDNLYERFSSIRDLVGPEKGRVKFLRHLQLVHDHPAGSRHRYAAFERTTNKLIAVFSSYSDAELGLSLRERWGLGLKSLCDAYQLTYPGDTHGTV